MDIVHISHPNQILEEEHPSTFTSPALVPPPLAALLQTSSEPEMTFNFKAKRPQDKSINLFISFLSSLISYARHEAAIPDFTSAWRVSIMESICRVSSQSQIMSNRRFLIFKTDCCVIHFMIIKKSFADFYLLKAKIKWRDFRHLYLFLLQTLASDRGRGGRIWRGQKLTNAVCLSYDERCCACVCVCVCVCVKSFACNLAAGLWGFFFFPICLFLFFSPRLLPPLAPHPASFPIFDSVVMIDECIIKRGLGAGEINARSSEVCVCVCVWECVCVFEVCVCQLLRG